jgi:Flp pilus assembly protein TadB
MLTARVPNQSLDAVMAAVARTGTVLSRSQTSDDVTSQYVDTQSRVRSQTASVERVRALLAKATTIGQVVQIEGELSRREADLESLEAQLKALQNQTALSTLTVDLASTRAPAPPAKNDSGFLAGLSAGWTALLASLTVLLTVLGALLPFLVVLALLGIPVLVWARRQRAARAAGSPPADPGQPQPQPAP